MPLFEIIEVEAPSSANSSCGTGGPDGCEHCGHCVMLRAMYIHNLEKRQRERTKSAVGETSLPIAE